jgi:hypothetical protein
VERIHNIQEISNIIVFRESEGNRLERITNRCEGKKREEMKIEEREME